MLSRSIRFKTTFTQPLGNGKAHPTQSHHVRRTWILRLYPNAFQRRHLETSLRLTRKFYNACLEQRRHHLQATGRSPTAYDQIKELPRIKEALPEFREPPANVLQAIALRLEDAFQRFFRGQNRFPRFKAATLWNSLVYPHRKKDFRIEDDRHLWITKLGRIRTRGGTPAWLEGAEPRRLVIKLVAGKWYGHVNYEIPDDWKPDTRPKKGTRVGIDLGIRTLATLNDGTEYSNAKNVMRAEQKLKRMQRRLARMKRGSNNRRKHVQRLQRQHARVKNRRMNHLHHVTRRIADQYERVVMEDVNPQGLVGNGYGKYQNDAAWGTFARLLTYKVKERGGTLTRVNPAGTSQECSACGHDLRLAISDRNIRCTRCGLATGRDVNAARNILARGFEHDVPGLAGEPTPVDTGGCSDDSVVAVPVDEAGTSTVA